MNPFNRSGNEKVAAVLTVVIGVFVGVIVGYFAYAVSGGADGASSFARWLDYPLRSGWIWWALTGAVVSVAVIYIRRLLSKSE